jgi:hypothetical protein
MFIIFVTQNVNVQLVRVLLSSKQASEKEIVIQSQRIEFNLNELIE